MDAGEVRVKLEPGDPDGAWTFAQLRAELMERQAAHGHGARHGAELVFRGLMAFQDQTKSARAYAAALARRLER